MSYLNHNDTFSQSFETPPNNYNDFSFESETEFLKSKLIETHQKLLVQLENNKSLEAQMQRYDLKNEQQIQENESLKNKLQTYSFRMQKQKATAQQTKVLQEKLDQAEKKNDLLRVDLDSMRNKMLAIMMEKNKAEQELSEINEQNVSLRQMNDSFTAKFDQLQRRTEEHDRLVSHWKSKYQQSIITNQSISTEYAEAQHKSTQLENHISEIERLVKIQKEKNQRLSLELQNCTGLLKETKNKLQKSQQICERLKQQVHHLDMKTRNEVKFTSEQVQKLTSELNQMTCLHRQRQRQIETLKKRPIEEAIRKKENLQHVKQLVSKLEDEQNNYKRDRQAGSPPKRDNRSTPKTYQAQKREYISMIEEVSQTESQLLDLNLSKKKLAAELDRIDNTKVKTKDLIARRRKLEDQISRVQREIDNVKLQLRKMKVI